MGRNHLGRTVTGRNHCILPIELTSTCESPLTMQEMSTAKDASIRKLMIAFQRLKHRKLFNLEIKSCNALKSVPFTKADVYLQQIHDMECEDDLDYTAINNNIPQARTCIGITYRDLFRYEIFDTIIAQGLEYIRPEHKDAVQLLLKFLESELPKQQNSTLWKYKVVSGRYDLLLFFFFFEIFLSRFTLR